MICIAFQLYVKIMVYSYRLIFKPVNVLVKNVFMALSSSRDRAEPLVEGKKVCDASMSKLEASPESPGS